MFTIEAQSGKWESRDPIPSILFLPSPRASDVKGPLPPSPFSHMFPSSLLVFERSDLQSSSFGIIIKKKMFKLQQKEPKK